MAYSHVTDGSASEILLYTLSVLDRYVSTGDRATSSTSSSNSRHDVEYHLRLCHVVEWPDFSGFGFNVHTLRDKPGQYVGKVDSGSPAAAAGLSSVLSLTRSFAADGIAIDVQKYRTEFTSNN